MSTSVIPTNVNMPSLKFLNDRLAGRGVNGVHPSICLANSKHLFHNYLSQSDTK